MCCVATETAQHPMGVPAESTPSSRDASVHELRVALGSGDDHVHPDPHGLCRGRHHVVEPVVGLHAEGEGGVGALSTETHAMNMF